METKQKTQTKGIIRLYGADIKGNIKLFTALQKVKGVNDAMSNAICKLLDLPFSKKIGDLTDAEIKNVEEFIKNPKKHNLPDWMLNRRYDPRDGETKHIISADLDFTQRQDKEALIKIKCYKGVRHMHKLPVRGQRTKGSFRKSGRAVGVSRKKEAPGKKK